MRPKHTLTNFSSFFFLLADNNKQSVLNATIQSTLNKIADELTSKFEFPHHFSPFFPPFICLRIGRKQTPFLRRKNLPLSINITYFLSVFLHALPFSSFTILRRETSRDPTHSSNPLPGLKARKKTPKATDTFRTRILGKDNGGDQEEGIARASTDLFLLVRRLHHEAGEALADRGMDGDIGFGKEKERSRRFLLTSFDVWGIGRRAK